MDQEAASDSRPGFAALWRLVVEDAAAGLRLQDSEAATQIARSTVPNEAVEIAHQLRLRLRSRDRRALEAGVAYELAWNRIALGVGLARSYATADLHSRNPKLATLILDGLIVYVSAFVDATKRLVEEACRHGVSDPDLASERESIGKWAKHALETLGSTRQPVAHAATNHIRNIDRGGLWEPLILANACGLDWLTGVIDDVIGGNDERFVGRFAAIQRIAVQALAEADTQLERMAAALKTRR